MKILTENLIYCKETAAPDASIPVQCRDTCIKCCSPGE